MIHGFFFEPLGKICRYRLACVVASDISRVEPAPTLLTFVSRRTVWSEKTLSKLPVFSKRSESGSTDEGVRSDEGVRYKTCADLNPSSHRTRRTKAMTMNLIAYDVLFVFLIFALATVWRRVQMTKARKGLSLPPGPPGLPIIGNILDMPKRKEWEVYRNWGTKYSTSRELRSLYPILFVGSHELRLRRRQRFNIWYAHGYRQLGASGA